MNTKQIQDIIDDLKSCETITPSAYEGIIGEFDVYPYDDYQKMYYTIGFNGEYDELLEKMFGIGMGVTSIQTHDELVNEGGDVCWYVTRLANSFGFSLSDIYPNKKKITRNFDELMSNVHKSKKDLSESVKKFYRDGGGELTLEWKERIFHSLCNLYIDLEDVCRAYGITLPQMMRANVLKLATRKLEKKLHGDGDKR